MFELHILMVWWYDTGKIQKWTDDGHIKVDGLI